MDWLRAVSTGGTPYIHGRANYVWESQTHGELHAMSNPRTKIPSDTLISTDLATVRVRMLSGTGTYGTHFSAASERLPKVSAEAPERPPYRHLAHGKQPP